MLIHIVYHMFTWCQGCIIQHMSAQAMLFQTDAKTSYCPSLQFCVCVCLYVWFYMIVKWSGSDTKHSLVNICQSAIHIHTRSFHRIFSSEAL